MVARVIMFLGGLGLTAFGIRLVVLHWWAVITVFKGVIGGALAVLGMVVLFAATIRPKE